MNKNNKYNCIDQYGDDNPVYLLFHQYQNNDNLGILLMNYDSEPEDFDVYTSLTVNEIELPYLHAAIDVEYSGNEKLAFIKDNNLGELTNSFVSSGNMRCPVVRFHEEVIQELNPGFLKAYKESYKARSLVSELEPLKSKINDAESRKKSVSDFSLDTNNLER